MATQVTNNIAVSVNTEYQQLFSKPELAYHLFAYKITIANKSDYSVQLISRHWFIYDSIGEKREVEGEGVVGQQPIIAPGESYTYESACNLKSEIGRMHGYYIMKREVDGAEFKIEIPAFDMIIPYRLN